jgi:hypothetical protein
MARKNKTQVAVEEFESQLKDLVMDLLGDIDMDKAAEYFESDILWEAVLGMLDAQEEEPEED